MSSLCAEARSLFLRSALWPFTNRLNNLSSAVAGFGNVVQILFLLAFLPNSHPLLIAVVVLFVVSVFILVFINRHLLLRVCGDRDVSAGAQAKDVPTIEMDALDNVSPAAPQEDAESD